MGIGGEVRVQPLLPQVFKGNVLYAAGVRAGRWIFATGLNGLVDYTTGAPSAVMRPRLPHWDTSKLRREADQIFRNLDAVMRAGGGGLENAVRLDQHYTSGRAVEAYHDARRVMMKDHIAPSTSTLVEGFLRPRQEIEVHMIGVAPQGEFRPRHIRPGEQQVHPSSGYSLALEAGDYVFVAGRMADGKFGEGLAQEARLPEQHLWKGLPIRLETEYIIREKIAPALKAAGSSLDNVVKCQVHMRDAADFGSFNDVWSEFFPHEKPATTLVPTATPGFFLSNARIEINTIALKSAAACLRLSGRATCSCCPACWRSTRMDSSSPRVSTASSRITARPCRRRWMRCSKARRRSAPPPARRSETSYASSSTTPIPPTSMALIRRGTDTSPAATCRSRP